MKHILVATDLSAHADRAVARAARLAEHLGAKLTLLHAADAAMPGRLLGLHRRETAEILGAEAERLSPRLRATPLIVAGDPWAVLADTAAKVQADLLVLGVHHKKRMTDAFVGTTSERVIRSVDIPVLVASRPVQRHYRSVAVGVDFSTSSRRALQAAVALKPQGPITAVHAYDVVLPAMAFLSMSDAARVRQNMLAEAAERSKAELEVWLGRKKDRRGQELRRSVVQGEAAPSLRAAVRRNRVELLAIGTRGLGAVARWLTGGVSARLLDDPPCDLLVVSARGS